MVAHLVKMRMRLLGILLDKILMKMAIIFPRCVILHMPYYFYCIIMVPF